MLMKLTVGHLFVNNQKVGQKVQKCAFLGKKSRSDLTYPIARIASWLETCFNFLQWNTCYLWYEALSEINSELYDDNKSSPIRIFLKISH